MLAGALCPSAFGLNPALDINQYAHKAWTLREDFFKGSIYAIAQMPDGYLWVGTEFGLARFDGVRRLDWQPPKGERLPGGRIRSLLAARDGRLWIGTEEGLSSWKDGRLTHYVELAGKTVLSILEDHEGTIWAAAWGVGSTEGRLCTIRDGRVQCYGNDGRLGNGVDGLYEDRAGKLWAGTVDGARWPFTDGMMLRLPAGKHTVAPSPADPPLHVTDFNGEIQSAKVVDGGVEFTYTAPARSLAVVDRPPKRLEVDGVRAALTLIDAGTSTVVSLPKGQHRIVLSLR